MEVEEVDTIKLWESAKPEECEKYTCPRCENKSTFHTLFIQYQSAGCAMCGEIEDIAKRLLAQRGYKFLSIEYSIEAQRYYITFECLSGHIARRSWPDIRIGYGCKECENIKIESTKCKRDTKDKQIVECDCKSLNKGFKNGHAYICEHYNFAIVFPEAYKRWCHNLNKDLDPHKLGPGSRKKAYFLCDKYNAVYQQTLRDICAGKGCVYCYGQEVCVGNSLATTHPEIAKLWHPDNTIKPTEIKATTPVKVWWLCEDDLNHKYERTANHQTCKRQTVTCPQCSEAYAQKVGGFEHYKKVCSNVHKNKYQYPDQNFKGVKRHVTIYCPIISNISNQVHGLFSQMGSAHKNGQGCPKCAQEQVDSLGVRTIKEILHKWGFMEKTHYRNEKKFTDLKNKSYLRLDFYVAVGTCDNKYAFCIEFDHCQHFFEGEWGDVEEYKKRDLIKDLFCVQNKISMVRIPYVHEITEEYLANLLNKCKESHCYFSYNHYEREVKKKASMEGVLVETVKLPPRFNDITCSFDD